MQNKVVIVTGGSRGIGAGITRSFLEKGAKVVINYQSNKLAAEQLQDQLKAFSASLLLIQADVGLSADRKKLIEKTLAHFGRIDILVNNAGISARKGFLKGTEEEFDAIIQTNLKGPIFLAKACAEYMIENNIQGSIVNISSVAGHTPNAATSYCAAKAGLIMATKTMALKLGPHGIRVNTVTPGTIKSDMNRRFWHDAPEKWDAAVKTMPLQRGGEPCELASAVLYLASDEASYITGSDLVVDGGCLLRQPEWGK
ncbi:MAG: 3-oxoacyl-ACP reductase FabG [Gammaproteobacteria bacterium]|nr:3-oxoacyl-ACP reductase FabG [Gammaproteobacteria bacterium]